MKKTVFIITIIAAVMLVGAAVAFAAGVFKTPAEIVSDLTGKTVDDVIKARESGETYGEQAAEAGKLEEFKTERLAQYKLALDEAVKEGRVTAEKAALLYDAMEQRMEACTGNGAGLCAGNGRGSGMNGLGRGNGTCGNCIVND